MEIRKNRSTSESSEVTSLTKIIDNIFFIVIFKKIVFLYEKNIICTH